MWHRVSDVLVRFTVVSIQTVSIEIEVGSIQTELKSCSCKRRKIMSVLKSGNILNFSNVFKRDYVYMA